MPRATGPGTPQSLTSLIRLDGEVYSLMGIGRRDVPPLPQQRVQVLPTRAVYEFEGEGVHVTLTFLTAALPHDLELVARPITYVSCAIRSTDGKSHEAQVYFDAGAELAVNTPDQPVDWARFKLPNLRVLRVGTRQQPGARKMGRQSPHRLGLSLRGCAFPTRALRSGGGSASRYRGLSQPWRGAGQ